MGAVAERFIRRPTAAAEPGFGHALHRASCAGTNFQIAFDVKRTVFFRRDGEQTILAFERRTFLRGGFTAGNKMCGGMAAIAKRFVFRCAAAAQCCAQILAVPRDVHLGVNREWAVFAHAYDVDFRWRFGGTAVVTCIGNRAGRAVLRQRHHILNAGRVRVNPLARRIGDEYLRITQHAIARVYATCAFEVDGDFFTGDVLDWG